MPGLQIKVKTLNTVPEMFQITIVNCFHNIIARMQHFRSTVSSLKNFISVYYFSSVVCIPIPRLLSHSKIQDFSVVIIAVRPCQILVVAATLSVLVLYVSPELDCTLICH